MLLLRITYVMTSLCEVWAVVSWNSPPAWFSKNTNGHHMCLMHASTTNLGSLKRDRSLLSPVLHRPFIQLRCNGSQTRQCGWCWMCWKEYLGVLIQHRSQTSSLELSFHVRVYISCQRVHLPWFQVMHSIAASHDKPKESNTICTPHLKACEQTRCCACTLVSKRFATSLV